MTGVFIVAFGLAAVPSGHSLERAKGAYDGHANHYDHQRESDSRYFDPSGATDVPGFDRLMRKEFYGHDWHSYPYLNACELFWCRIRAHVVGGTSVTF